MTDLENQMSYQLEIILEIAHTQQQFTLCYPKDKSDLRLGNNSIDTFNY